MRERAALDAPVSRVLLRSLQQTRGGGGDGALDDLQPDRAVRGERCADGARGPSIVMAAVMLGGATVAAR